MMIKRAIYILFLTLFVLTACQNEVNKDESLTKIALRSAANDILLVAGDSSSVVKPIKKISEDSYLIEFESSFPILPDSLVKIMHRNIMKAELSIDYQLEVLNCVEEEVEYSFQMSDNVEKVIVSCSSRAMDSNCYLFKFSYIEFHDNKSSLLLWLLLGSFVFTLVLIIKYKKRKEEHDSAVDSKEELKIGQYHFNQSSHQLIFEEDIIRLSKKEVELLMLLYAHKNELVKREYLVQKVWEEQGVVVGRSLDTYISKLRKKLSKDQSIKITNLHGVGYKLEVK